jgi:hypothetical protein
MAKKPSKAKAKRPAAIERPKSPLAARIMAAADAHWHEVQSRLNQQQGVVRRKPARFEVPAEVMEFLSELYEEPALRLPDGGDWRRDFARAENICRLMRDAYLQGCSQGYIEGVVARMEPDRKRNATANAAKRKAPVQFGKIVMTRDKRDELMAAEYAQLITMMKPTPACQRLAIKYEYESWQGVAKAIKAFHARRAQ